MKKLTAAAGLALALSAGSAFAADLPSYKSPPPPPPPMFSWTGVYGGVNIGYGFGNGDRQWGTGTDGFVILPVGIALTAASPWTLQSTNLNGVIGGGQFGVNFQFNRWLVLGVEADIQASGLQSRSFGFGIGPWGAIPGAVSRVYNTTTSNVDWYGSWRARFGVTPFSPNLMLYGTAGLAYGGVNTVSSHTTFTTIGATGLLANGNGSYDKVSFGWTAGAGAEWAPMSFPNWSLKVEYLYTDLGSATINTVGIGPAFNLITGAIIPGFAGYNTSATSVATRWHTVRAGINYRIPLATAAPVYAAY